MQSLDVISVNIWHILISLINLVLLFLIVKKFLFAPAERLFSKRKEELDGKYKAADEAVKSAEENKRLWEEKLRDAKLEADSLVSDAADKAKLRADKIVKDAEKKANEMTSRASEQIALEKEKASQDMRREIVDVSVALTEKMLSRKLEAEDKQNMIDEFISEMGGGDGQNE